jgi:hypothetical protein
MQEVVMICTWVACVLTRQTNLLCMLQVLQQGLPGGALGY